MGYEVKLEEGHFISRDGNSAMMILETPAEVSDGFASRELISHLKEKLNNLPPEFSSLIVCGHLHTVSNEDVMKRDIKRTVLFASVGFFLIFFLVFRDPRGIFPFLIPLVSVVIAINLSSLIFPELCLFIIGMGAVIAGISVDYGIHVYSAIRSGEEGVGEVKKIAKPILASALTTLAVFLSFFFSSVSGYHQLAVFSILSIVFCLWISLFIFPHLLGKNKTSNEKKPFLKLNASENKKLGKMFIFLWVVFLIFTIFLIKRIQFASDIKQFDGSSPEVFESEEKFHETWGGKSQPAILVSNAASIDEAFEVDDKVFKSASQAIGKENVSSLAPIWPGKAARIQNSKLWENFWDEKRVSQIKTDLIEAGKKYQFSENAFSPFYEILKPKPVNESVPVGIVFFDRFLDRFLLANKEGYQILNFFPDEEEFLIPLKEKMESEKETFKDSFIVSRETFLMLFPVLLFLKLKNFLFFQ